AGTWKCEYVVNDMKRTSTLTVKKDGDKLSGTMIWQDKKEAKLQDVKFKDGELTFSADREVMDNKFTIKFKLKVEGDKVKGEGEGGSAAWAAQREKKAGCRRGRGGDQPPPRLSAAGPRPSAAHLAGGDRGRRGQAQDGEVLALGEHGVEGVPGDEPVVRVRL